MSSESENDPPDPVWARAEPRIAGGTDIGAVRRVNQDAYGRFDDHDRREILLVVADGLGGHRGGEVASRMAVSTVGEQIFEGDGTPEARMRRAILDANQEIHKAATRDRTLDGMGTTIVCLLLSEDGPSYVAHVGDSRLYRLRSSSIRSVTEDHSLVATLVKEGLLTEEEARTDRRKNQILRALGVRAEVEVDIAPVALKPGDVFLLCSDGLHGLLSDDEIHGIAHYPVRPTAVISELIDAANAAGGDDNITCMLAHVPKPMPLDTLRSVASRALGSALEALQGKPQKTEPSETADNLEPPDRPGSDSAQ